MEWNQEGDYIVRAAAANHQIRAFAATTRNLTEEARMAHNTSPVVTAALGRLLTAGAMMGAMMKGEEDLLTLQIMCDGPIGGMVVTANARGEVKGYVHQPSVLLPPSKKGKLDVGGAVGKGMLRVIRDMGLKDPYTGQTQLVSGEIAEDLTYYFAASEQTPSSVALGVLMNKNNTVKRAGGFILQLMPFAEEDVIARLEERIGKITGITGLLDQGLTPEQILEELLEGMELEITDRQPAGFVCGCDKKRVERALLSLGRSELESMVLEGKPVELKCHFCSKAYAFTTEELEILLKSV